MLSKKPLISPVEAYLLVFLFLAARLTMLWLFQQVTGGKELASDVVFHDIIISEPLAILNGTARHIASYPPFQWVVEWPLFNLYFSFFNKMVSYRLLMITVELATFILLIYKCRHFVSTKTMAICTTVLFIISPHQYLSTVLFVQEDIISQLFMIMAAILLLSNQRALSIATLSVGVLVAKLFFIIPLFYVVFFHGKYKLTKRIIDGFFSVLPIVIVYYITITNALSNGGEVPIRDFTPDAIYAANYWVLLLKAYPDSLESVKYASVVLSAGIQLLLIACLFVMQQKQENSLHPVILLTIPLAFFYATFYQHMPEYFLLLWPVIAMLCSTIWQQLLLAGVFSVAWAPRIFHGLQRTAENFGTSAEARSEIVGPFLNLLSINPELLNSIALVVQSIIYTAMLIWVCVLAWNINQRSNTMPR